MALKPIKQLSNGKQSPLKQVNNRPQGPIKALRNGGAASFTAKQSKPAVSAGSIKKAVKSAAPAGKKGGLFKRFIGK